MSIQFYALPDEVFRFVAAWSQKLGLWVLLARHSPEEWQLFSPATDNSCGLLDGQYAERSLTLLLFLDDPGPFSFPEHTFLRTHPDCVQIRVGCCQHDRLEETILGTKSTDARVLRANQALSTALRNMTRSGMWARNTQGQVGFYKNDRYTPAVAEAMNSGLKPTPIGAPLEMSIVPFKA